MWKRISIVHVVFLELDFVPMAFQWYFKSGQKFMEDYRDECEERPKRIPFEGTVDMRGS